MYSFSMERFFSTCALGLLVICLGSVMACGTGKVCARVRVLMMTKIANRLRVRMQLLKKEKNMKRVDRRSRSKPAATTSR